MTDRELLKLAAKAAGITLSRWGKTDGAFIDSGSSWSPLTNDGDALRLAVKLDIHISLYGPDTGMNTWVIDGEAETFDSDYGDDPCAAVRRLIVRAAAFIGAKLP